MPINYFIGKSKSWLVEQLGIAQEDFANGKTVTSAGAGDSQVTELVQVNVRERIEQIYYSLYLLDPVTYPLASTRRASRTKFRYKETLRGG